MKARKLLLAMMTIASITLFNACTEDACEGETCSGNGTPVEAAGLCSCDCDNGYSGSNCEIVDLCIVNAVDCGANGDCADGACVCDAGYEGDSCQTVSRVKFLGVYDVTDACSASGAASYQSTITASGTTINKVLIDNFWDSFVNAVEGTISGSTITIPTQEPDGDGFTVTGTGTISGDAITLTLNYSVADGANTDVCQSTWTKQ
ncbi:MAG: hypothetical protein SH857_06980 [Chitinophagales bacterium]|nr:hypothetical protein [Chitinophagales bacterium]